MALMDLPKIDLTKFELPRFDMPKVEFPKVELPRFEMPKIDMPDLGGIDETITDIAKDAAYITIGFGVLAAQKAQVRRRELTASVNTAIKSVETQVRHLVGRDTAV